MDQVSGQSGSWTTREFNLRHQGLVPERPIFFIIILFRFCILHSYTFCVIITVSHSNAQQYFVTSSCMFLHEKTLLGNWLNPGLNLTIFLVTKPSSSLC